MKKVLILTAASLMVTSCNWWKPPSTTKNICTMLDEKRGYKRPLRKTWENWGVPPHVIMAVMKHESNFDRHAKPPRKKLFWIIPHWKRISSASGYSQALDGTWKQYQKETGRDGVIYNLFTNRSNFASSVDFMGWYMDKTHKVNKVSKYDAYHQYLAYHEGQGNFARGSHRSQQWLLNYARKVNNLASRYQQQLRSCPLR
jgi:hypothetical protein